MAEVLLDVFAAEFWSARVAAADPPVRPAQTRIPQVPDQSEFLERWYDHHRGYRTIVNNRGVEERIAVLGEPLKDVAPGYLPRTLDQLRSSRNPAQRDRHIAIESLLSNDNTQDTPQNLSAGLGSAIADIRDAATSDVEEEELSSMTDTDMIEAYLGNGSMAPPPPTRINERAQNAEYQARRVAALRRELQRMRSGIERVMSGLQELGENVPDSETAINTTANLDHRLEGIERRFNGWPPRDESLTLRIGREMEARLGSPTQSRIGNPILHLQNRLDEATTNLEQARSARERAADELEASEGEVQAARERVRQFERDMRSAESHARVFGTREEMERQGADYESPIGGMFNRAWGRYRAREEERRSEQMLREIIETEDRITEGASAENPEVAGAPEVIDMIDLGEDEEALQEYYAGLRSQGWMPPWTGSDLSNPTNLLGVVQAEREQDSNDTALTQYLFEQESSLGDNQEATARQVWEFRAEQRRRSTYQNPIFEHGIPLTYPAYNSLEDEGDELRGKGRGLDDKTSGRPEPKEDGELTITMECKVCYTQLADTACLPCGHLVMCQWCANKQIPTHHHDRTIPRRPANCPLCRKKVKQRVKIYRG
ncbi:MAG: hypothetical protein M1827_004499 [Pycnora praestabilis]|nr:MAG: hypothetical protein M1827_004499 [Pycnora praestabilis]